MGKLETLLWCDLETDCLRPDGGCILEIGLIVTTADPGLEVLGEWSTPVAAPSMARAWATDEVKAMHDESGLWHLCLRGGAPAEPKAMGLAAAWARGLLTGPAGPLCGSSPHFDRAWLDNRGRGHRISALVTHRCFDASTLVAAAEMEGREPPDEPRPHRAVPDLARSIALARWAMGAA